MLPIAENIREVCGLDPRALPDAILAYPEPLVLRGVPGAERAVSSGCRTNDSPKTPGFRLCWGRESSRVLQGA